MNKLRKKLKKLLSIALVTVMFLSMPVNAVVAHLPENVELGQSVGELGATLNGGGVYSY